VPFGTAWELEGSLMHIGFMGMAPTATILTTLLSVEDTAKITTTPLLKVVRQLSKENKEKFL